MLEQKRKIVISGSSGFIGTHLTEYLKNKGYEITPLGREIFHEDSFDRLKEIVSGAYGVINLAGANLFHLWTKKYKEELYSSRIKTTQSLVNAINEAEIKPQVFISTSAVGYYPVDGCYDEYNQQKGEGFLADLCEKWEEVASGVNSSVRLVITRLGIVLADKGGAFAKMAFPARLGVSPVIGSGQQNFSWIGIDDLLSAYQFIIDNHQMKGVVNMTAPYHLKNRDFMKALYKHYNSFLLIRIPEVFFRMSLREASQFAIEGQCAVPTKLMNKGFVFQAETINRFLEGLK